jgi:DNA modification methylase
MVLNDGKERKKQHRDTNLGSYEYSPLGGGQVRLTSVFSKSKAELPAEHGKPVEWIAPIIAGAHVNNVLDLFGGAGSTIIACEQVGISCFTMEIDPVKCQNIKNRVEDYLKIEHT